MRKCILFVLIAITAIFAVSCSNSQQDQEVTAWIASTTATQTEETTEQDVTVKAEEVTESGKKKSSSTSKSKSKKKKNKQETTEETTEPPTQGVVKSGRNVEVTTVVGSINSSDFNFVYNKATVKLNSKIDAVFESVGEDNVSTELSKKKMEYDYSDFVITTYIDDSGAERVEKIVVVSEDLTTAKGAGFGTYGTGLRRIYGNDYTAKGSTITYTSGSKKLVFTVEDNLVVGISYVYSH